MASEPTLREFAEQISRVVREYADTHGWPADSYRLYLRFNEKWDTAHVMLVSGNFDERKNRDTWKEIMNFLKKELFSFMKYFIMFNLTLRSFDQINEGGIYAFGPEFVPVEDFLATRPVA